MTFHGGKRLTQLTSQNTAVIFPPDKHYTFCMQQKCFMCTSHFVTHSNTQRTCVQKGSFHKINFIASRTFLKLKLAFFFFNFKRVAVKNTIISIQFVSMAFGSRSSTHHYFCTIIVNVNIVKKSSNISIL